MFHSKITAFYSYKKIKKRLRESKRKNVNANILENGGTIVFGKSSFYRAISLVENNEPNNELYLYDVEQTLNRFFFNILTNL